MSSPRRNVELKATDDDAERSLRTCRSIGARDEGVLWQRDTYFTVQAGGLKLREQDPGGAHLIQFDRADVAKQRESRYRIVDIADAAMLLAALADCIGISIVVTKRRHLFIWRNVRIHLDRVEHLGTFIELEAVAPPESDLTTEHQLVDELRTAFALTDDRLVARGYASQLKGLQSAG